MNRVSLGIIILIGGVIIAFIGYNMAQTAIPHQNPLGQLFATPEYQAAVSQQRTGNAMLGVGIAAFVIGLILTIVRRGSTGKTGSE
ncbi:MAG: hypothetical protein Q8P00_06035 [Dehalococcoidia bacterium]|nr:hypothetical protein [Dehalococcoidia bacterium]